MAHSVAPLRPLPAKPDFPKLEEEILERWRERDIFRESVRRRQGAEPYVFYEGPPTANGRPGSHHVIARAFKDIFPRYQTMRGRYVERKGGWDCHGLPVEIAVEQKLGFKSKDDIERYGIAEFNAKCRESVFEYLEDWDRLTERIGYWVDLEQAYRTLEPEYIESVWWALKTMWERDLLYEGHKVVPYCARCGTALSSHEVSEGYQDVEDPSVYVAFPVTDGAGALRPGDEILAWTTTPWTLLSNAALAVSPELAYVRTEAGHVIAEARAEAVLGEGVKVTDRFHGRDMLGARYEPPFTFIATEEFGPKGHTVVPADFVSAEDGTGVVHTSISFGEDDFRIGQEQGIAVINPVKLNGAFDERMGQFAGLWVKDADPRIVDDLRERGRLLKEEAYLHAYPHCWRCGTPLLYYAKPSWYIRTSSLRDRLLAANESVDWHPEHIKHGRMGKWLENNVDWAISRERYWGTPLPVWRNEAGETMAIGSLAELEQLSGVKLDDPHRPYVDDVEIPSPSGGEPLRRVPEVIDVWFDSGSMPFAQWHAPHENEEHFRERFPADYICEAIDQTRGWFYSLLAISTLLFDQSPYRTCLVLGHIADEQGRKMSKSLGNIVAPWDVIDKHGADAFRWYFFASKFPWDGYMFSVDTVGESLRQFLLQLWNTYGFLVLYTNVNDVTRARGAGHRPRPLGAVTAARDDRDRARAARRLRRHARRPRDRRVRRRAVELVRAPLPRALLGRRPGRLRHAPHLPGDGRRSCSPRSARSSPTRSTTTSTARSRASTCATSRRPVPATASSRWRWRSCARACGSASPPAGRPSSACASRCAPPWWWPPAASARRSSGSRTSSRPSSTSRSCASSPRPTSSAPTRSSPTTARSARASASTCRRWRRRWPRSTPATSPTPCATVAASGSASTGTTTSSTPTTCCWPCSRSRATSSSARARTPSPSSSSSTTTWSARASRARSSTRSRTRARRPASRSPTGSSSRSAATTSCSTPRGRSRPT